MANKFYYAMNGARHHRHPAYRVTVKGERAI
jgi:hypothetical protein